MTLKLGNSEGSNVGTREGVREGTRLSALLGDGENSAGDGTATRVGLGESDGISA